ncbi:MAG: hypothetical protein M3N00_01705 [Actinomycetota bacterium]|nr:hypothetical protein [Actinomycetota bacterium]
MSAKAATVFIAVLASLSALSACGGGEQARGNTDATRASADAQAGAERTTGEPAPAQKRGTVARAGGSEARAGDGAVARAGSDEAPTNGGKKATGKDAEANSQGVTLEIGGDPGTEFFGTCSVGGEEKTIGGRVPARYVYEPGGDKLECEIRKGGAGTLEVVLAAGNNVRSVQRTDARESTINLAYSSSGISLSTLSSAG